MQYGHRHGNLLLARLALACQGNLCATERAVDEGLLTVAGGLLECCPWGGTIANPGATGKHKEPPSAAARVGSGHKGKRYTGGKGGVSAIPQWPPSGRNPDLVLANDLDAHSRQNSCASDQRLPRQLLRSSARRVKSGWGTRIANAATIVGRGMPDILKCHRRKSLSKAIERKSGVVPI